ncbi:MAG: NAD(P)H-binding protein [Gemmatimonadetes bacterium]|nr:NAD(P)H-binding protein [Gemmatimonadota bacterium]
MTSPGPCPIFVTGATGYLGRAFTRAAVARGHRVRGLVRRGRAAGLAPGVTPVEGDALVAATYASQLAPGETLVQLVGTPHPGPAKAAEFRAVDLPSGLAAVEAALAARVPHLVYVSVAHPAPVMHAYIAVRCEVEARVHEAARDGRLAATILQPWYILGPGHRWPLALAPLYALGRLLPATRAGAARLGLVTLPTIVGAMLAALAPAPAAGEVRTWDVPMLRARGAQA